jgi:type IV pilus assembly protein PilN
MIRVNLLPQKRELKRSAAGEAANQSWLLAVLGVVVVEIIGLFLFHQVKREELAKQVRTNAELTSQIDQIKKAVANHADVKAQLEVLRAREDAIAKLQQARSGPTAVMLEVSRVLTTGRGPTVDPDVLAQLRRDNPTSVYNPGWDPRRLWLTNFAEADRLVKIDGLARDGDDVSELARRLSLSVYFAEVKLLPASKTIDSGLDVIRFQLQAKARY